MTTMDGPLGVCLVVGTPSFPRAIVDQGIRNNLPKRRLTQRLPFEVRIQRINAVPRWAASPCHNIHLVCVCVGLVFDRNKGVFLKLSVRLCNCCCHVSCAPPPPHAVGVNAPLLPFWLCRSLAKKCRSAMLFTDDETSPMTKFARCTADRFTFPRTTCT